MPCNTTAFLDKLTCIDYVDFGYCQDRFGQISGIKSDSKYLDLKLNVLKENVNKEFRLIQKHTMGEADFNQFMRLRNQLVIAAENFARLEDFTPMLIPTLSKDMDEQLKLARKVFDVVDRANKKHCVTLLRYNVDKCESSNAQVQLFARKKDEKFQQFVYVIIKLEILSSYLM